MTSTIINTIAAKLWIVFFSSVCWLPFLLCADLATAADDAAWQRGQALYRNGWNGQAACIRCHGSRGEGREEGGLRAPALAGKSDPLQVQRAMLEGIGSNGQVLHPLMPRYQVDAASLDDLLAYLKVIDQDTPGLSESVLRIGVVLPPTAYGAAIQAGLNKAFDQIVYGRRLQLIVNSSPAEVLVEIANLQQDDGQATNNEALNLPVIGPLPVPGVVNFSDIVSPNRFHLLPSAREQARALLTQVALDSADKKTNRHLVLVYDAGHNPGLQLLLPELREQARLLHQTLREQVWPVKKHMPGEAVIFLGSATNLPALLEASGKDLVYANAIHVGPASLQLAPAQAGRLRLLLPWHTISTSFDLATAYSDAAYASGAILVEALKRCGRQLGRAELLQQLDKLREFPVPDFGKIDFHPGQHHGGHGGQIIGVNPYNGLFTVLRTWQETVTQR
ncbi:c-type cytochrome [Undibacterium sp. Ji49W]|uniref:cytochrome c/ABC transporter substrate-binding protein n=1 Tax=Undibacterium sp. Ji49W TaxID=3413040 RepID=UPI003BF26FFB